MPEPETPAAPATSVEEQPAAPETPATATPLTVDAIKEALLPEVRRELKAAYDAARRAEAKAERVPQQVRGDIARLEAIVSMGLSDEQRKALDAAKQQPTPPDPQAEYERASVEFQRESAEVLASEGISADDPVLREAWTRYSAEAQTPSQWRTALGRSVAAVRKAETDKVKREAGEQVSKAREDERKKLLNEQRGAEGKIDRGAPVSGSRPDYLRMSDAEFDKLEATKKAERTRRRIQTG